jgi:acetylornithine deacetylase/succinyl-diaminopimelate desuccinylase-like protein
MTPTMISASEKINVIPAHAELQVDCRVLPGGDQEHARARAREILGEDGYELRFDESVVGNRSSIETPLMDTMRGFVKDEDPGAEVSAVMLPGFSDSRWFRDSFPDCVAYGFFPQNQMDLFEVAPLIHGADERVPVEDLGLAARCYARLAQELLR